MYSLRRRSFYIGLSIFIFLVLILKESSLDDKISKELITEISNLKDSNSIDLQVKKNNEDNIKIEEGVGEQEEEIIEPCTIINPLTNQFYDLRELSSIGIDNEIQAWNAKGFDYGRNFSIGICSTPLRQLKALTDYDFIDTNNKSMVGGYYTNPEGNKVSIGKVSTDLKFRGLNLVLEYNDGDKCENSPNLFKSTLLTFKCDREMMSKARVSYLGSMNNCSYFFEVRTVHACATANEQNDNAVWGIFLMILLSAIGVYFFAGIMYSIIKRHYERSMRKNHELV